PPSVTVLPCSSELTWPWARSVWTVPMRVVVLAYTTSALVTEGRSTEAIAAADPISARTADDRFIEHSNLAGEGVGTERDVRCAADPPLVPRDPRGASTPGVSPS